MRCLWPIGLALLTVLLAAACTGDLSLPSSVSYACGPGLDCPSGYVCLESDGRCVRVETQDTEPPELVGEPLVEPGQATVGRVLVASFSVSEDLSRVPEVVLHAPGGLSRFALDLEASEAPDYRFTYRPSGAELSVLEEAETTVTATLVDLFGNRAEDLLLGAVLLDVQPPRLVGTAELDASLLAAGATATLAFTASETLDAARLSVVFDDGTPWTAGAAADETSASFSYTAEGTEAEGCRGVYAVLADPAGNVSAPLPVGAVCLDFTAPTKLRGLALPAQVKAGQHLLFELAASEPLAGRPAVESDPAGLTFSAVGADPSNQIFVWERRATVSDPIGKYSLTVTLTDQAGNQSRVEDAATGDIVP